MHQTPLPGKHKLQFRGDIAVFTLRMDKLKKGTAFLRTNLGAGELVRKEIISQIEKRTPRSGLAWHDLPMERIDDFLFSISIACTEVGHFEAKCFFYPKERQEPEWVGGENVHINVEPAEYFCANSIYCAFVRQFGKGKTEKKSDVSDNFLRDIKALDKKGYTVIPPSGTFRDLEKEIDFIFDELNCTILHLLPVNPTPTLYGRMGRYGSPYAALDYTAVDPGLAEFDRTYTPLEQFFELIDTVHMKNGHIFLDLAINHTGWAAKIHEEHPEWLMRENDGSIHSPGAWGVTWGDLTELDYKSPELWCYFAEVFLTWCERGIDGFRCDAGYMIPVPAWEYIIAKVRSSYPDTIFLLEGLGGDPEITKELLDKANMNWAYSELFQNYSKDEITNYINIAQKINRAEGIMVHYAETHDNNRMAATSPVYCKMRTTLCALLSFNGAFGFANGVEWFATEKIDVHKSSALNWGNKKNQVEHIARLNKILASHTAFSSNSRIRFVNSSGAAPEFDCDTLIFTRKAATDAKKVIVICNLNHEKSTRVFWDTSEIPLNKNFIDLLTERAVAPETDEGKASLLLDPGEILLLSNDAEDSIRIDTPSKNTGIRMQKAKAMVLDVITAISDSVVIREKNIEKYPAMLLNDPRLFCAAYDSVSGRESKNGCSGIQLTRWQCPADLYRQVMIPPGHVLFLTAPSRFRVKISRDDEIVVQRDSLQASTGDYFVLLPPFTIPNRHTELTLSISLFDKSNLLRKKSELLLLSRGDDLVSLSIDNQEIHNRKPVFLDSNKRGAICRIPVRWGETYSRYDALISANLHPEFPVDRWIMWAGCRMWIKNQAHTQALSADTINNFSVLDNGSGCWDFHLPAGNGMFVDLRMIVSMTDNKNSTRIEIYRQPANDSYDLPDDIPVRLIIRPDMENRSFHATTQVHGGPDKKWPKTVKTSANSFTFAPDSDKSICIAVNNSSSSITFHPGNEWRYNIHRVWEASRGLDAESDLFSPGHFSAPITGCETVCISGDVNNNEKHLYIENIDKKSKTQNLTFKQDSSFSCLLMRAMEHFIVKRNELKTVIAGYPWFLDWGRDTLICARGMIAAGWSEEVAEIILAFAKFAENGTLPNIIHGAEAGNRDTSDAPLWLFAACRDYQEELSVMNFHEREVPEKEKSVLAVLEEIAEAYIEGTPNGIKVDIESGLVFSPSHFTWMDTNYPAGTPREGYPVEIQALWYSALSFLSDYTGKKQWIELAQKVKSSINQYFLLDEGWLSDCLHAKPGCRASDAVPDDALRPNQLLAITMGVISDHEIRRNILHATETLLIPGGIRSLADRPVSFPLPIVGKGRKKLNDPVNPYWGRYEGDEDTRRKPAYHNGTAWTWIFPSYAEAYYMTYGKKGKQTAKSILSSSKTIFKEGCVGQIPEILDGNLPHRQRGCDAQAWGATELYRVWKILNCGN